MGPSKKQIKILEKIVRKLSKENLTENDARKLVQQESFPEKDEIMWIDTATRLIQAISSSKMCHNEIAFSNVRKFIRGQLNDLLEKSFTNCPKHNTKLWSKLNRLWDVVQSAIEKKCFDFDISKFISRFLTSLIDLNVITRGSASSPAFDIGERLSFIHGYFKLMHLDIILNCKSFSRPKHRKPEIFFPIVKHVLSYKCVASKDATVFAKRLLVAKLVSIMTTRRNEGKTLFLEFQRRFNIPSKFAKWAQEHLSWSPAPDATLRRLVRGVHTPSLFQVLYPEKKQTQTGQLKNVVECAGSSKAGSRKESEKAEKNTLKRTLTGSMGQPRKNSPQASTSLLPKRAPLKSESDTLTEKRSVPARNLTHSVENLLPVKKSRLSSPKVGLNWVVSPIPLSPKVGKDWTVSPISRSGASALNGSLFAEDKSWMVDEVKPSTKRTPEDSKWSHEAPGHCRMESGKAPRIPKNEVGNMGRKEGKIKNKETKTNEPEILPERKLVGKKRKRSDKKRQEIASLENVAATRTESQLLVKSPLQMEGKSIKGFPNPMCGNAEGKKIRRRHRRLTKKKLTTNVPATIKDSDFPKESKILPEPYTENDSDLEILEEKVEMKDSISEEESYDNSSKDEASGSDGDIEPCDEENMMFTSEQTETYHQYLMEKVEETKRQRQQQTLKTVQQIVGINKQLGESSEKTNLLNESKQNSKKRKENLLKKSGKRKRANESKMEKKMKPLKLIDQEIGLLKNLQKKSRKRERNDESKMANKMKALKRADQESEDLLKTFFKKPSSTGGKTVATREKVVALSEKKVDECVYGDDDIDDIKFIFDTANRDANRGESANSHHLNGVEKEIGLDVMKTEESIEIPVVIDCKIGKSSIDFVGDFDIYECEEKIYTNDIQVVYDKSDEIKHVAPAQQRRRREVNANSGNKDDLKLDSYVRKVGLTPRSNRLNDLDAASCSATLQSTEDWTEENSALETKEDWRAGVSSSEMGSDAEAEAPPPAGYDSGPEDRDVCLVIDESPPASPISVAVLDTSPSDSVFERSIDNMEETTEKDSINKSEDEIEEVNLKKLLNYDSEMPESPKLRPAADEQLLTSEDTGTEVIVSDSNCDTALENNESDAASNENENNEDSEREEDVPKNKSKPESSSMPPASAEQLLLTAECNGLPSKAHLERARLDSTLAKSISSQNVNTENMKRVATNTENRNKFQSLELIAESHEENVLTIQHSQIKVNNEDCNDALCLENNILSATPTRSPFRQSTEVEWKGNISENKENIVDNNQGKKIEVLSVIGETSSERVTRSKQTASKSDALRSDLVVYMSPKKVGSTKENAPLDNCSPNSPEIIASTPPKVANAALQSEIIISPTIGDFSSERLTRSKQTELTSPLRSDLVVYMSPKKVGSTKKSAPLDNCSPKSPETINFAPRKVANAVLQNEIIISPTISDEENESQTKSAQINNEDVLEFLPNEDIVSKSSTEEEQITDLGDKNSEVNNSFDSITPVSSERVEPTDKEDSIITPMNRSPNGEQAEVKSDLQSPPPSGRKIRVGVVSPILEEVETASPRRSPRLSEKRAGKRDGATTPESGEEGGDERLPLVTSPAGEAPRGKATKAQRTTMLRRLGLRSPDQAFLRSPRARRSSTSSIINEDTVAELRIPASPARAPSADAALLASPARIRKRRSLLENLTPIRRSRRLSGLIEEEK